MSAIYCLRHEGSKLKGRDAAQPGSGSRKPGPTLAERTSNQGLDSDLYHLRTTEPLEVSSYLKHSAKESIEVTTPPSAGAERLLPEPVS